MSKYIKCPFCWENDFDAIGLKRHLLAGRCEQFNETPDDDPPKRGADVEESR